MIERFEKMAETAPQVGMYLATLKFSDRQRAAGKMPTKGLGDLRGSINDLNEHWPQILTNPDEEYLEEDEKYYQAFLKLNAEKADGEA